MVGTQKGSTGMSTRLKSQNQRFKYWLLVLSGYDRALYTHTLKNMKEKLPYEYQIPVRLSHVVFYDANNHEQVDRFSLNKLKLANVVLLSKYLLGRPIFAFWSSFIPQ